ncbi:hypothetical protein D3C72_561850 [compost metagenome]
MLVLPHLGVEQAGSGEELGIGRSGHQDRDGDARPLELVAQGERKAVNKGLAGVVDGLKTTGHEPGDRAGEKDSSSAAGAHAPPDQMRQPKRSGDIGVHHMEDVVEGLVEKTLAEPMPGVGGERVDPTSAYAVIEGAHALLGSQVNLDRLGLAADRLQILHRVGERPVRRQDEIIPVFGEQPGEFITYTRRGAGHYGERTRSHRVF